MVTILKRFLIILMSFTLLLCAVSSSSFAAAGIGNFTKVRTYSGQFSDAATSDWFFSYVRDTYELGLFDGKSASAYEPRSNLTIAEAIKLAVSVHSIYFTGSPASGNSAPWYSFYVDYALNNDIIPQEYPNYEAYATRAQFVTIIASALPPVEYKPINNIADNAIPDITNEVYSAAVYTLYRAGIVTGIDSIGTFSPNKPITRAEVSVVLVKTVKPEFRNHVSFGNPFNKPRPEIQGVPNTAYFTLHTENTYNITGIENANTEKYATATVADMAVAICEPGKWDKALHVMPLTIKALSYGTTIIKLDMYSSDNHSLLASRTITVCVIDSSASSSVYYPGYYPIVDFGATLGISSTSGAVLSSDGGNTHIYKKADIFGYEDALENYVYLMEQNGFIHTRSSDGVDSFSNYIYGWSVKIHPYKTNYNNSEVEYIMLLMLSNPYN